MAQLVKNLPAISGDLGSIPGLGRAPGEGKGYPLVFCPGEPHELYSPWVTKSRTQLSNFQFHFLYLQTVDVCVMRAFKIHSVRNFQIFNTILFTMVTMLYITSS